MVGNINIITFFVGARIIKLIDTNLNHICDILWADTLSTIAVQFNPVSKVDRKCFYYLSNLVKIILDHNRIVQLETKSFSHLPSLQNVHLSYNNLTFLPQNIFVQVAQLTLLSLLGNKFLSISPHAFQDVTIASFQTNDYRICCLARTTATCCAPKPWYKSCSYLLPNLSIHVIFIVVSSTVLILNVISFCIHWFRRKYQTFAKIALSINVSDILFGIFLCLIWIANEQYSGGFAVNEQVWRASLTCFLSFSIVFLFNWATPCTLYLLSLTRLIVVAHPFSIMFRNKNFISKCVVMIYVTTGLLTVVVVLVAKQMRSTLPSNLCLPFLDPENTFWMIKLLTWSTSLFQILVSGAIIFTHWLLVKHLKKSQENIRKSNSKSHLSILIQLIALTVSNIFCWIPTNIVYIISIFLSKYPSEMVVWTAVVVAPTNSVMNPLIFLISHSKKT